MKVIICGAGIAGLALARGLLGHDVEVVVVERSSRPRQQGYMIDFFGPGVDGAAELGVLEELRGRGYAIDRVSWYDRSGRRTSTMRYDRFSAAARGKLISLLRPDVEQVLRHSIEGEVEIRWGAAVTHVRQSSDHVQVDLSDGSAVEADLLVGADGIHSRVREAVFGPEERFLRPLGFHTAAWVFTDPVVRERIGTQWVMTDTLDAQVGLYGLSGAGVAGFGVHRAPEVALPADPRAAVREAYGGLGWVVPQVLEHCPPGPEMYYDVVAQVEVPRWVDRRVVLLGDACQAVSLIGGQGASLAVAAGCLLARLLVTPGADLATALESYEQRWRPVAESKQETARRGVHWFLPSNRRTQLVRRAVTGLSGLPGVSRLIVNSLAGKQGTLLADLELSDRSVSGRDRANQHRHHQVPGGR